MSASIKVLYKFINREMRKKINAILFLLIFLLSFYPSTISSQVFSEGFNGANFPPPGWTETPGLWSKVNYSGFCSGTGSAMANFFAVTSGTYSLTTPVFGATGPNDSLIFQDAYASFSGENDQLQIMYSVNGGITYSQLVMLNGGTSGELVTAPARVNNFVPACSQWKYQRRALPMGTNRLRFNGISAFGNNLYIDSIYIKNTPISGPLCESFNLTVFPPTGWYTVYSGTDFWLRGNRSGFGLGSGCAEYNIWNAFAGTVQTLASVIFSPVTSGDSLSFDIAYAPFPLTQPFNQDSLIIMGSTNGGTSYLVISRLGPLEMQTSGPQTNEFVPASNQWGRRQYPLPVGTNRIQFIGYSALGNNIYLDSTCVKNNTVGIINNNNEIPADYSLSQNYPNPFNPSTRIDFTLPKSSFTKLAVYDVLGKKIDELINQTLPAGKYSVNWNGSHYASGIFFYKLISAEYTETKSMILVK